MGHQVATVDWPNEKYRSSASARGNTSRSPSFSTRLQRQVPVTVSLRSRSAACQATAKPMANSVPELWLDQKWAEIPTTRGGIAVPFILQALRWGRRRSIAGHPAEILVIHDPDGEGVLLPVTHTLSNVQVVVVSPPVPVFVVRLGPGDLSIEPDPRLVNRAPPVSVRKARRAGDGGPGHAPRRRNRGPGQFGREGTAEEGAWLDRPAVMGHYVDGGGLLDEARLSKVVR